MKLPVTLSMTGEHHHYLKEFLFPGDNKEAVAILLCTHCAGNRKYRLLVREVHPIPYELCVRSKNSVHWQTEAIEHLIDKAENEKLSVIKIHSHPTGYPDFSSTDDTSDKLLFPSIQGSIEANIPHGSAIMLPDGKICGRIWNGQTMEPMHCVNIIGDDLLFWHQDNNKETITDFTESHAQIFDQKTIDQLKNLSIAVIGCSGTGSPLVEQLFRLGVGELVLVDDDYTEDRNINRILNSSIQDAREKRYKTDVIGDAIKRAELGTRVIRINQNLWKSDVIREVAQCDVVFGCMDTIDGRFLLNMLATFYLLPYFDVGVRLDAIQEGSQKGFIREICGTINYLQPGKSSLLSRGLFTIQEVAVAGLKRNDPAAHNQQLTEGYIAGVPNHRPAVISVNMLASSLAVNEFLARIHPYREESNREYSAVTFSLASMELFYDPEAETCVVMAPHVGKGDVRPLLLMPELS